MCTTKIHLWDTHFGDDKVNTGILLRAITIVHEGSGIPLNKKSIISLGSGASYACVRVSICNNSFLVLKTVYLTILLACFLIR